MQDRDLRMRFGESVSSFEPEKAAADDDDWSTGSFGDGVYIVDVAERENARQIHSGNTELDRLGAGRKDELGEGKLPPVP
jgi:hypothetical protein